MRKVILILFGFILWNQCTREKLPEEFSKILEVNQNQFDIWVKNGQILNGLDTVPIWADILIKQGQIAYIGPVDSTRFKAAKTIDAKAKIISPGFIDTHAHGDPLETPHFDNFLSMGVTSICLGQDGFSPQYEDLSEWFEKIDSVQPSINLIPFVGHSSLRLLSGADYNPDPSEEQLKRMNQLLEAALQAGCFGMTTGLEYTPGQYAGKQELTALAKIVGQYDGLIMSHIRNEDDEAIEASINELLEQGEHCNVHVAHLKVVYGKGEDRAEQILQLINQERDSKFSVTADLYPYMASYTGIGIVFPDWAKAPNDYGKIKASRREELLTFLRNKVITRNGPEATLLGTAPYAGKTLEEVSEEKEKPFEKVLLEDIGPKGASGAYFVMNDALQERLLQDPKVMVCSDGSPTMRHPRGYGSFAKIIETYTIEKELFPLYEAIRKMTSLPAQTLGLEDRGVLAKGKKADILIFKPENIKAKASFVDPHLLAEGFDWVIVNGRVALKNGNLQQKGSGKLIRKQ